ncbi:hypothetical protein CGMCC3_g8561 [Colletotrichum fructicola]|nr:uncharacterized protein CGMCC3_g8561 [Colletotrichum fructicola]KAE9575340.1 hypothetical protein CGMCC3_g8561 [Colletotrichum fructicola]
MDPGTALAVVGLSLQVLGGMKEYYKSWKDCDDDVTQFREAIQRLTTMLDHLKSVLLKPHLDPSLVSTINDVCDNLKGSAEKMETLLKKVRDHGPPSTVLQKLRQMGRRACYPFRAGTISHFMGFVADMTDDLSLAMQVLTLNTIAEGQGRHTSLQDAVAVMDSKQDEGWKRFQRKEFWDWLDPPDHVSSHDHAATLRERGTGGWFVNGDVFVQWISQPRSRLWLHGGAGAGKTVLCSTIVETVKKHLEASSDNPRLAYYYFAFDNIPIHDIDLLLRSLICQLWRDSDTAPELGALYSRNFPSRPSRKELRTTLLSMLRRIAGNPDNAQTSPSERPNNVFIIFDGLDEIPQGSLRDSIIEIIHTVASMTPSDHIHILFTGRYERDVANSFPIAQGWKRFGMERKNILSDIESYIMVQLKLHSGLNLLPERIKDQIRHKLVYQSNGMFRWTALQMQHLKKLRLFRPYDVMRVLESLPRDLYGTYDRILSRLDSMLEDKDHKKPSSWLRTCYSHPMSRSIGFRTARFIGWQKI